MPLKIDILQVVQLVKSFVELVSNPRVQAAFFQSRSEDFAEEDIGKVWGSERPAQLTKS